MASCCVINPFCHDQARIRIVCLDTVDADVKLTSINRTLKWDFNVGGGDTLMYNARYQVMHK